MISISTFNELCAEILQNVGGIKEHLLVAHEEHAVNKLKTKAGVILLAIFPSADREGGNDGGIDANSTWFFILEKLPTDQTNKKEIEQYEKLQEIILDVREFIEEQHSEGDTRLRSYKPGSCKIDPEYNEFGGYNGWSMSLVF